VSNLFVEEKGKAQTIIVCFFLPKYADACLDMLIYFYFYFYLFCFDLLSLTIILFVEFWLVSIRMAGKRGFYKVASYFLLDVPLTHITKNLVC